MTQQALRRHDDQRLAIRTQHLPSQHVKHLRRRGWYTDLNIVFSTQLQESLESGRRVLRTLSLVAVWQEQRQATHAAPFCFAGADELINNHLGAIGEIAELAVPDHQRVRFCRGIAVLESHHSFFGQQRIDHPE